CVVDKPLRPGSVGHHVNLAIYFDPLGFSQVRAQVGPMLDSTGVYRLKQVGFDKRRLFVEADVKYVGIEPRSELRRTRLVRLKSRDLYAESRISLLEGINDWWRDRVTVGKDSQRPRQGRLCRR